jgi:hypothetical protein
MSDAAPEPKHDVPPGAGDPKAGTAEPRDDVPPGAGDRDAGAAEPEARSAEPDGQVPAGAAEPEDDIPAAAAEPDDDVPAVDESASDGARLAPGWHVASASLLVVILVLAGILIVRHTGTDTEPVAAASPSASSRTKGTVSTGRAAPDHGTLSIAESGFRNITTPAGDPAVSWGVILSNSSRSAVAAVLLKITYRDHDGATIAVRDFSRRAKAAEILPGSRAGVGGVGYLPSKAPATVQVSVDSVLWTVTSKRQSLRASNLTTDWRDQGQQARHWKHPTAEANRRGNLYLTFRVESTFPSLLSYPAYTAVYRDEHGRIVGGAPLDSFGTDVLVPAGWSEQTVRVWYPPPAGAVDAKTEVYLYSRRD